MFDYNSFVARVSGDALKILESAPYRVTESHSERATQLLSNPEGLVGRLTGHRRYLKRLAQVGNRALPFVASMAAETKTSGEQAVVVHTQTRVGALLAYLTYLSQPGEALGAPSAIIQGSTARATRDAARSLAEHLASEAARDLFTNTLKALNNPLEDEVLELPHELLRARRHAFGRGYRSAVTRLRTAAEAVAASDPEMTPEQVRTTFMEQALNIELPVFRSVSSLFPLSGSTAGAVPTRPDREDVGLLTFGALETALTRATLDQLVELSLAGDDPVDVSASPDYEPLSLRHLLADTNGQLRSDVLELAFAVLAMRSKYEIPGNRLDLAIRPLPEGHLVVARNEDEFAHVPGRPLVVEPVTASVEQDPAGYAKALAFVDERLRPLAGTIWLNSPSIDPLEGGPAAPVVDIAAEGADDKADAAETAAGDAA